MIVCAGKASSLSCSATVLLPEMPTELFQRDFWWSSTSASIDGLTWSACLHLALARFQPKSFVFHLPCKPCWRVFSRGAWHFSLRVGWCQSHCGLLLSARAPSGREHPSRLAQVWEEYISCLWQIVPQVHALFLRPAQNTFVFTLANMPDLWCKDARWYACNKIKNTSLTAKMRIDMPVTNIGNMSFTAEMWFSTLQVQPCAPRAHTRTRRSAFHVFDTQVDAC